MSIISGGKIIYNKLEEFGVKKVFGYSGGAIMGLFDCFYNQNKIQLYIPPHEAFVGFQAIGYSKSHSKNLGVGIVTSGPGVLNCITPLLDAQNDSTAFLLLSGNVPVKSTGKRSFQEAPAVDVTKSLTKWSYAVKNINELPYVMDEAIFIAMEGKQGSVHIDLPKCIISSSITDNIFKEYFYPKTLDKLHYFNINNINKYPKSLEEIKLNNKIKKQNDYENGYNKLVELIKIAKKPVIIAGNGVNDSYKLLRKFAKKTNIPVTTTIHAMGSFREDDKLSLGFHGMHGIPSANMCIQESDLIINLGGRFCDRTTGPNYGLKAIEAYKKNKGGIVHINIEEKEFNMSVKTHININSSCENFFKKIITKLDDSYDRQEWFSQINKFKKNYPLIYEKKDKPNTQSVIIELNKQITKLRKDKNKEFKIVADVGNNQMISCQFLEFTEPRQFISSGSVGSMGTSLPYAIGQGLHYKNNKKTNIISIIGDGGFEMCLTDLKSINRYNLENIKILVCNNQNLSMVNCWEKLFFNYNEIACDNNDSPPYDKISENYGIKSFYVDNYKDLKYKINLWLNYEKSSLLHCKINKSFCFPLVSPGNSLDNMILSENELKTKKINKSEVPS